MKYWQAMQDGSVAVGHWIRMLYDLLIKALDEGAFLFDIKKANKAIAFIEKYVHHYKGRFAPGTLKLELWQKAAISCIFGLVDENGYRQFREVFMCVGRKCGKTLLASGIIAYMAYADGEYGAEIYCIAPKLDQADLVYSAFRYSVDHEAVFSRRTRPRKNDLYIEESNTTIKKVAFSDRKSDGYNPHLVVGDELAAWQGDRGLKQWEVFLSGMGARTQPIALAISSGGYVVDGIYDELFKRSTQFLQGNSKEKRLLPFLYQIDEVTKWDDLNELRKSLPMLGISIPYQFIQDEINTAYGSISKRIEFCAKYANLPQNSSQAWLMMEDVKKCFVGNHYTFEDFRGCYALAGVDLSQSIDLTAATVLIHKNGVFYFFTHFFMPAEKLAEATARDGLPYDIYVKRGLLTLAGANVVDVEFVFRWFTELIEKWQIYVLKVGYDRYSAPYFVKLMDGYGFHVDSVYQGTNLTGIINDTEGMIKDGRLQCADENDLMKVHMLDSALKIEAENARKKLIKIAKNAHVDGMASLLDAMCMRANVWEEYKGQLLNAGK